LRDINNFYNPNTTTDRSAIIDKYDYETAQEIPSWMEKRRGISTSVHFDLDFIPSHDHIDSTTNDDVEDEFEESLLFPLQVSFGSYALPHPFKDPSDPFFVPHFKFDFLDLFKIISFSQLKKSTTF